MSSSSSNPSLLRNNNFLFLFSRILWAQSNNYNKEHGWFTGVCSSSSTTPMAETASSTCFSRTATSTLFRPLAPTFYVTLYALSLSLSLSLLLLSTPKEKRHHWHVFPGPISTLFRSLHHYPFFSLFLLLFSLSPFLFPIFSLSPFLFPPFSLSPLYSSNHKHETLKRVEGSRESVAARELHSPRSHHRVPRGPLIPSPFFFPFILFLTSYYDRLLQ